MATVQEAVRRLTIQTQTTGAEKTARDLRLIQGGLSGVAVESQKAERATVSMERRLESIQRQYDKNYRSAATLAKVERDLAAAQAQGLITLARKNELLALAAAQSDRAAAATGRLAVAQRGLSGVGGAALGAAGLGGGAAVTGILAAGFAVSAFIKNSIEAQKALTQLQTVIASTGGAAGMSATELTALASEMQRVTTFGDDAVISAEALLLTFTKVGRDVFPQAIETILDMSAALNQDLKSSSIQLGKALNDPIKGITALTRVGVSFTESQKEMIETMVDAGDIVGAQTAILKELQTEFGGSARAARETLGGALEALKNSFGDLFEVNSEGSRDLVRSINDLVDTFSDPAVIGAIQDFGAAIFDVIAEAIRDFTALIREIQAIAAAVDAVVQGVRNVDFAPNHTLEQQYKSLLEVSKDLNADAFTRQKAAEAAAKIYEQLGVTGVSGFRSIEAASMEAYEATLKVPEAIETIPPAADDAGDAIKKAVNIPNPRLRPEVIEITGALKSATDAAAGFGTTLINGLANGEGLVSSLSGAIGSLTSKLGGDLLGKLGGSIGSGIGGVAGSAIGSIFGPIGTALGSAAGGLLSNLFGSIFGDNDAEERAARKAEREEERAARKAERQEMRELQKDYRDLRKEVMGLIKGEGTEFDQFLAGINDTWRDFKKAAEKAGESIDNIKEKFQAFRKAEIEAYRADFTGNLQNMIWEGQGKGHLGSIGGLITEGVGQAQVAAQLGVSQDLVVQAYTAQIQQVIDGAQLTGAAFDELIAQFPILAGQVTAFVEVVDPAVAAAEAVADAQEALRRAYEAEATRRREAIADLQSSIAGLKQFTTSIRELKDSLRIDRGLSPLDPAGRLAEARRQFETATPDTLAASAQAYLTEAKDFFASSPEYAMIFDRVQATLDQQLAGAESQLSTAELQLSIAEKQLAKLEATVNAELGTTQAVLSVADAIHNLHAAVAAQSIVGMASGGVVGMASGGIVGNGTFGVDSVVARYAGGGTIGLAGGEYVMPAAQTRAHLPQLEAMRSGGANDNSRILAMGFGNMNRLLSALVEGQQRNTTEIKRLQVAVERPERPKLKAAG